jgi:hypothetical protein
MTDITGWGRGAWSSGPWSEPNPVVLQGEELTATTGNVICHLHRPTSLSQGPKLTSHRVMKQSAEADLRPRRGICN